MLRGTAQHTQCVQDKQYCSANVCRNMWHTDKPSAISVHPQVLAEHMHRTLSSKQGKYVTAWQQHRLITFDNSPPVSAVQSSFCCVLLLPVLLPPPASAVPPLLLSLLPGWLPTPHARLNPVVCVRGSRVWFRDRVVGVCEEGRVL